MCTQISKQNVGRRHWRRKWQWKKMAISTFLTRGFYRSAFCKNGVFLIPSLTTLFPMDVSLVPPLSTKFDLLCTVSARGVASGSRKVEERWRQIV
uniref:Uncharacterized protein n=1 Tax=Manihot esculenta TaxID=3983 RepID=A0A2C9VXW2_MANES